MSDPYTTVAATAAVQTAIDSLWSSIVEPIAGKAVQEAKWRREVGNYYDSLYERVAYVRVLGRKDAEPIDNIFTDVNVLNQPSSDYGTALDTMRVEFAKKHRQVQRHLYGSGRIERISGLEALETYNKLYVLGRPGAGKTTYLKWTTLQAINGTLGKEKQFPIFVTLREMADWKPDLRSKNDILEYITSEVIYRIPECQPFVERLLKKGSALVLFDGLDEVNTGDDQRRNLINALNQFVSEYSESQYLLSCRVAATDYSFEQFEYVEMADFDDGQVAAFIDNWFANVEESETKRAACKAQLLGDGASETLRELAQNPLLLTLLALVYEERNEFPPNRDEIYEEATRALLIKWDSSRNIRRDSVYRQLDVKKKRRLLATIAAQAFDNGEFLLPRVEWARLIEAHLEGRVEDVDGEIVLDEISAQHGLLVERARGIYSFGHLTLQEYFTAQYIVENEARGSLTRLMTHIGDDRWREVFILTASMLADGKQFCKTYLSTMSDLIQENHRLIELITRANERTTNGATLYRASAVRCYYVHSTFDNFNTFQLLKSLDPVLAHDVEMSIDLTLSLVHDTGLILARSRDLVQAFDNTIDFSKKMRLQTLHKKLLILQTEQPQQYDDYDMWVIWAGKIGRAILEERITLIQIHHKLGWPNTDQATLRQYLDAGSMFVACVDIADLRLDRKEWFKDQLLLPHDGKDAG